MSLIAHFREKIRIHGRTWLRAPVLVLLAAGLFAPASLAQESAKPVLPQTASAPSTDSASAIPSYPDTAKGLEKLMKDMIKLQKEGNLAAFAPYAKSLVLPGAVNWYKSVFGGDLGEQLAASTDRERSEIAISAWDTLKNFRGQGLTGVKSELNFEDACGPVANQSDYPALLLRRRAVPLYTVRFSDGQNEATLGFFTYLDGGFRYVGSLEKERPIPPVGTASPKVVRLPSDIMQSQLIHWEGPKFPTEAKAQHVEKGNVVLLIRVSKDGRPEVRDLASGPCVLAVPAIDAVRRWLYKPVLLNGQPVEVDTTVTVSFELRD
jgi:hypothetical protein